MITPQELFEIPREELFEAVDSPEYQFHELKAEGILDKFLARFPNGAIIFSYIMTDVFDSASLTEGWENEVLNEVNELIKIQSDDSLKPLTHYKYGEPDHHTNEAGILNSKLLKLFSDQRLDSLTKHEFYFLHDLFYGVDSTRWTRDCIVIKYTKVDLQLDNILKASRNKMDFSIENQTLILKSFK